MAYKDPGDERAKAARLKWYYANKEKAKAAAAAKRKKLVAELRRRKDNPCTDCGQRYPYYVMQFDHIGDDKEYGPATLVTRGSFRVMDEELAKCELVCANCHAERTHNRRECATLGT